MRYGTEICWPLSFRTESCDSLRSQTVCVTAAGSLAPPRVRELSHRSSVQTHPLPPPFYGGDLTGFCSKIVWAAQNFSTPCGAWHRCGIYPLQPEWKIREAASCRARLGMATCACLRRPFSDCVVLCLLGTGFDKQW